MQLFIVFVSYVERTKGEHKTKRIEHKTRKYVLMHRIGVWLFICLHDRLILMFKSLVRLAVKLTRSLHAI